MTQLAIAILCLFVLIIPAVYAHQPVMDMAPRWKGGYGFQTRYESRYSDKRLNGSAEVANPSALNKRVSKVWLEGIYTHTRELRFTAKLPYIDQRRTVVENGQRVEQTGTGMGDLVLGIPLKKYHNLKSSTGSNSITPSIRFPTGSTSDPYPVSDGSTDFGISVSVQRENRKTYRNYDLFYWVNTSGKRGIDKGNVLGMDINLGYHPYHDNNKNQGIFVMADIAARHEQMGRDDRGSITGGQRLSIGPVFVVYRNNFMARAEYRMPIYEKVKGTQLSHGPRLNLGAGLTF
ncbi:MAG: transporter [Candidatus Lindowbacteria bacterium]|nr:transporter [Candidatus Lindowbacteria bacterium]